MATDLESLAPRFLIAMPQLGDPNFHRSVVLMIEHGEAGSMGLVINRSAPLSLGELAEGQSMKIAPGHAGENVFVGGPVEPQRGFVLHDCETIEEKHEVIPGLYLSFTLDALQPLPRRFAFAWATPAGARSSWRKRSPRAPGCARKRPRSRRWQRIRRSCGMR